MKRLQYFITVVWGFLTPALALDGAQQILLRLRGGGELANHAARAEFFACCLLAAGVCILAFLLFDFLFSKYGLPQDGKRLRHFVLNVFIYGLFVPVGWFAMTLVGSMLEL